MYSKTAILIPTLNEKENLEKLIPAIFEFLSGISILIVDDNSSDSTKELIDDLKIKFPNIFLLSRNSDFGYGKSIMDGFKWLLDKEYDYIVTMDADFSHDFYKIPEMLEALNRHDIVLGSRYTKGGEIANWNLLRKFLSRFANLYVRLILNIYFYDVTTGFVAYKKTAVKKLATYDVKSEGYAFLVESKYLLYKNGFSIGELPIVFRERRQGKSKMSYGIIWESIWLPWCLKLRKTKFSANIGT